MMGVGNVLSTMRGTPCAWAAVAKRSISSTSEGGVGDGLAEDRLRVGAEGGLELGLRAIGCHERAAHAHALERVREQVERSAVDSGARDDVVARTRDVEDGEEVRTWPELVSMAAAPPSSSAILAATASFVGFCSRV